MNQNRLAITAWLLCVFVCIVAFLSESNCYAQSTSTKLMTLTKSEGKLELHIGDRKQTIAATQYTGRADEKTIVSERGFLIGTKEKLKDLLSKYAYTVPPVDFDKNLVVYYHSDNNQCIRLTVDVIAIEDGKLKGLVPTEIMQGGAEKENKLTFALIVLPKSALK